MKSSCLFNLCVSEKEGDIRYGARKAKLSVYWLTCNSIIQNYGFYVLGRMKLFQ